MKYLEYMRDLRQFRCRPSTLVAVSPAGEVLYPCLEKGTIAGSLLEAPDLHALRAEGRRRHGPDPVCPNQCQSACALGFSLILDRPTTMVSELGSWYRTRFVACSVVIRPRCHPFEPQAGETKSMARHMRW